MEKDKKRKKIVVMVSKKKSSGYAMKWAIQHLFCEGDTLVLVHVRPPLLSIPTPLGNSVPIDQVCEDVAATFLEQVEMQTSEMLLPYQEFCCQQKILFETLVLEDQNVPFAIANYISDHLVSKLVVGSSSHNALRKIFMAADIPVRVASLAPSFCTVYVVSKGKLVSVKSAVSEDSIHHDKVDTGMTRWWDKVSHPFSHHEDEEKEVIAVPSQSTIISDGQSPRCRDNQETSTGRESHEESDEGVVTAHCYEHISMLRAFQAGTNLTSNQSQEVSPLLEDIKNENDDDSLPLLEDSRVITSPHSTASSFLSLSGTDGKEQLDMCNHISEEKRKKEFQNSEGLEFKQRMERDELILEDSGISGSESESDVVIHTPSDYINTPRVKSDLSKTESVSNGRYKQYSIQQIEEATDYFTESLKIGEGSYGSVFKCTLDGQLVAIKVLHPDAAQGWKQFKQEVHVLSSIKHPHILLLLGVCNDVGCLVYEYMANGNLEDRLFRREATPSLSWKMRFRIACEIATGLLFLHKSKPKPIVHRDLKPANILLDEDFSSKIGDVGLAKLASDVSGPLTEYRNTTTSGTFCYIDPEYQQTGILGTKSDLYAFGIVLLQLLTAKQAMGLTYLVERAIEKGAFKDILDKTVKDWPIKEALDLAKLALKCVELRRRDRPSLETIVLPELQRINGFGHYDDLDEVEKMYEGRVSGVRRFWPSCGCY